MRHWTVERLRRRNAARIHDHRTGRVYETRIERHPDGPRLVALTVEVPAGEEVDNRVMHNVPCKALAKVTAETWLGVEPVNPTLEQVGQEWAAGLRRGDFAAKYGVSVRTVDGWVYKARRQGLVPPAPQSAKQ